MGGNIDVTSATDFRHPLVPGLTTKPNWLDLCDLDKFPPCLTLAFSVHECEKTGATSSIINNTTSCTRFMYVRPLRPNITMSTIPLSEKEQKPVIMATPAVSTVTFYRGVPPIEALQVTVNQLLDTNPWLGDSANLATTTFTPKCEQARHW